MRPHTIPTASPGQVPSHEPGTRRPPAGAPNEAILTALERHRHQPGVALIAFDQRNVLLGERWIAAPTGEARCALVGRHRACDLVLPGACAGIELRHLVVIAHRIAQDEVQVRVVDLRSATSPAHEPSRAAEAVTGISPWILSLGAARLALLPTGDASAAPERARPTRALRMTVQHGSAGALADAARPSADDEAHEANAGRLTVSGMGTSTRYEVGERALARGILIGRSTRCDLHTGVASAMVSRVHLLVVRVAGELLAIDARSRNGTYRDGEQVALCRLTSGSVLDLGGGGHVQVLWEAPRVARSDPPSERRVVSPATPG